MWFLIKTSLVFSMALVALSYFSSHPQTPAEGEDRQLQLADAFIAASGAYAYVSGLCAEKPEVCEKGVETFTALAVRAKEGARVAYEFLDTQLAPGQQTASLKPVAAPSQPMPAKTEDLAALGPSDHVVTGTVPLPQRRPER